jgi:hypothetical protein
MTVKAIIHGNLRPFDIWYSPQIRGQCCEHNDEFTCREAVCVERFVIAIIKGMVV